MREDVFSEYYLERYILGELPEEFSEIIRKRASADSSLQSALEDIAVSNRDILSQYPPAQVKREISARLSRASHQERTWEAPEPVKSWSQRRFFALAAVVTAAALVCIFLVLPSINREVSQPAVFTEKDISLVKGDQPIDLSKTQLLIFRKTNKKVDILKDRNKAAIGDLMQLAYVSGGEAYGMIFSIDGRGVVTLHLPEDSSGSTQLTQNKRILLPHAFELDDAPDFERFFLITSNSPIDVAHVLQRAEILASGSGPASKSLDLPEGLKQQSVLILKGEGI